jgi:hypothetical protein
MPLAVFAPGRGLHQRERGAARAADFAMRSTSNREWAL